MQLPALDALASFVCETRALVVISGAGCSTESGIPDYRDTNGEWKRKPPVRLQEFLDSARVRQRYWSRSLVGWDLVRRARPNPAHRALAVLESAGRLRQLITQNVDGLHQRAGSRKVIDLHGRVDAVCCLTCGERISRDAFQRRLEEANPTWRETPKRGYAPDGDADLEDRDLEDFRVPACTSCGGMLKPDVVFFGESVPKDRVCQASAAIEDADSVLIVGSSLMVWSGYRFVRQASLAKIPVAAINLGRTRADADIELKVAAECGPVLSELVRRLNLGEVSG